MRTYRSFCFSTEPNWELVPAADIDCFLWETGDVFRPKSAFQLCFWEKKGVCARFWSDEANPRAVCENRDEPVYEDSCLEFFFMHENDKSYFNFEINPNGCLNIEYGPSGADRECIVTEDTINLFDIRTGRTGDGWEVFYSIPLSFIRSYSPGFRFSGRLVANMYKCGNKTVNKHFLSWVPIDLERPNFHCPGYFGTMKFH